MDSNSLQPLLFSKRGQYQFPFKLWGCFTPVGVQTCPFVTPFGAWGNTGEQRGLIAPTPENLKSTRNSTGSVSLINSSHGQRRTYFGKYSEIHSTPGLKSLLACKQLSWPRKVLVYTSQSNASESCLLSASCGLFCHLTSEAPFSHPATSPSYSAGLTAKLSWVFWSKSHAVKKSVLKGHEYS